MGRCYFLCHSANNQPLKLQTLLCSVQLARRVLQLERANTSLRKEIEREKAKMKQLAEEVSGQG